MMEDEKQENNRLQQALQESRVLKKAGTHGMQWLSD